MGAPFSKNATFIQSPSLSDIGVTSTKREAPSDAFFGVLLTRGRASLTQTLLPADKGAPLGFSLTQPPFQLPFA